MKKVRPELRGLLQKNASAEQDVYDRLIALGRPCRIQEIVSGRSYTRTRQILECLVMKALAERVVFPGEQIEYRSVLRDDRRKVLRGRGRGLDRGLSVRALMALEIREAEAMAGVHHDRGTWLVASEEEAAWLGLDHDPFEDA